jgi:hypothetical protein
MDINGAKALKERLGEAVEEETPPARADVPEDAPPVFHWTGVSQPHSAAADRDDAPAGGGVSKFFRLGLSFR